MQLIPDADTQFRTAKYPQPVIKNVFFVCSRALNCWFQRPQYLVPEPPSRGGGAAQKIDLEKSCRSQKSQPLGAYGCRYFAIFVSESKNIYNHTLGLLV